MSVADGRGSLTLEGAAVGRPLNTRIDVTLGDCICPTKWEATEQSLILMGPRRHGPVEIRCEMVAEVARIAAGAVDEG